MPWRMKSDMQHFKALTIGKPVVMGRKTFASLASRCPAAPTSWSRATPASARRRCRRPTSFDARSRSRGDALRRGADEIVVIGGAEIYAHCDAARRPAGDHRSACEPGGRHLFPADRSGDRGRKSRAMRHAAGPDDDAAFSYVTYRRRSGRINRIHQCYIDKYGRGIAVGPGAL